MLCRPSFLRRSAVVAAGTLGIAMLGVVAPPVGAIALSAAAACVDEHGHEPAAALRSKSGGQQDPNAFTNGTTTDPLAGRPLSKKAAGSVVVPTVVHVIHNGAVGKLGSGQISRQMNVLNAAYAGATGKGAAVTPFRFELTKVNYVDNAAWYTFDYGDRNEKAAKNALRVGGPETLNVYLNATPVFLGWATFPDAYSRFPKMDGVVVLNDSLPGGPLAKYSEGDTLVHEVGHWLSLFHTFQNSCSNVGDYVADTAPEKDPAFNCPVGLDTCPAPGTDPIRNFMDYSQDSCMYLFTPGQSTRMATAWDSFRRAA